MRTGTWVRFSAPLGVWLASRAPVSYEHVQANRRSPLSSTTTTKSGAAQLVEKFVADRGCYYNRLATSCTGAGISKPCVQASLSHA